VSFFDAGRLWLLVVPLVLAIGYIALQFRRTRYRVILPTAGLASTLAAPRRRQRHVLAAAFVLAVAAMVVALARPVRTVRVPRQLTVVMVALDTSASMQAKDVKPTRLAAAKAAAARFVDQLPDGIRVGLLTFSGDVALRVPPTLDRGAVLAALQQATPSEGTAMGEAVYRAVDAIRHGEVLSTTNEGVQASTARGAPGSGIVLLSDGESTVGRPPGTAAMAARNAHVRVSTIGFGTDHGTVRVAGEQFKVPVGTDELRALARDTGGRFLQATTRAELRSAYDRLGQDLGYVVEQQELANWFLAGAFLLALLALGGTVAWSTRIP
jgi:Ca-activated chloride channel family protein